MKKTIICSIPMREHVANTVYSNDDGSLPVSDKPFRYPINSLLSQTVKEEDELKIILLIKKDGNSFYEKNTVDYKHEIEIICADTGAKAEFIPIDTAFSQKKENHEQLMGKLIDGIDIGSHIMADITYGPKDLPIVIFSALSFAEKFLKCDIDNIVYGQADFENDRVVGSFICDMIPLYCLSSVTNTIKCDDPQKAKTDAEIAPFVIRRDVMVIYDKDEYEQLIDSSLLFTLDREKEHIAYRREALKMVEYLYCYLIAINVHKYEPFGVEIVDTAKRCIENYKPDSGRFLNYFNSAWKQTYGHLIGKELVRETFKGIHFTEDEERNFRKYMKLAQNMGVDTESSEFNDRVAEAMGISTLDVNSLRSMINCKNTYGSKVNEEGEEYSLIDQLDSGKYTDTGILQFEAVKELLDIIELTFNQLQERQKPMLAMLITSKIAFLALEDERIRDILKRKKFFDEGIFEETMNRGEQIQAKEIANRFGVVEASASRSWKRFKDGLKIACHHYER